MRGLLVLAQVTLIFASSRRSIPPAFCSQLLEETYGALRGWTPSEPQLLKLCSGLMVKKLRMARTTTAAHGPCKAFATGISARRSETQGPLPPLATLKVDWCGAYPKMSTPLPEQEPRRVLLAPPPSPKPQHKQAFVNLDDEDRPKVSSNGATLKHPAAPLHVMVQNKQHHHHHRPRDWESLTDREALLRARDAILSGGDDSAVLAAANSVSAGAAADSKVGSGQARAAALVSAPRAKSQGFLATSMGYISQGASWAKSEFLSTLDFVCDGHCGIQRKPEQFEVVG
eukprot:gnl/MRDRNA2_/MRDRNA2_119866_c0_seq1.p1 gnl/MRDRNA2_/MRDRNA2_119866_c0~~gnl/MRDRNA2_/MRDRNA2_119866_c0_seq1.p1  ORF type:complete len:286 (+),score=52.96 gnl/MRDRNA2_/MRDRNA2_119866_c0_seq1:86-943(+)